MDQMEIWVKREESVIAIGKLSKIQNSIQFKIQYQIEFSKIVTLLAIYVRLSVTVS